MADNYLEKKMEDYRRGLTSPKRLPSAGKSLPGNSSFALDGKAVLLVAESLTPVFSATVALFRRFGCKVNLCVRSNPKGLQELAWRYGCTFHPGSFEEAFEHAQSQRGRLDGVVFWGEPAQGIGSDARIVTVGVSPVQGCNAVYGVEDSDSVASAVLFLTFCPSKDVAVEVVVSKNIP